MYQFYYSDYSKEYKRAEYKRNLADVFHVTAVRPTMWEEHCLECSAPACYSTCPHYIERKDGRCRRFYDGYHVYENSLGCNGQGMRIKFHKWADMMTIIFPAMLDLNEYRDLKETNDRLGEHLQKVVDGHLPVKMKWLDIRTEEFIRRKKLRNLKGLDNVPDAFVFHGYSFNDSSFQLVMEIYDENTSVYKTSLTIEPGENICLLSRDQLNKAVWTDNYLVKIYPENDIEAELDILWCDFVKGSFVNDNKPADKVKCVVWDLDNTLWNGILLETDNTDELLLNKLVLDTIKLLDERGIIQSIASKNDFEPAWDVIKKMGIDDYFLYPQIHWGAKSASIENIAHSLNIGTDSMVLIDDSAFERNQVMALHPEVRTYDPQILDELPCREEFDVLITEESKKRRLMYKAEEKRNHLFEEDNSDLISFLKKCNLRMEIFKPESEEELQRCYELVVRTNQLNMSGKKYSKEEFLSVIDRPGHKSFAFSCQDDFGKYGIVGFGQYIFNEKVIEFTEFAMSCRVAGKYVESALFTALLNKENCETGEFKVQKTKKNTLLRRTLSDIGFVINKETDKEVEYSFGKNLMNQSIVDTSISYEVIC